MNFNIMRVSLLIALLVQPLCGKEESLIAKGQVYAPGTSMWSIMADLEDMLRDAHALITSLSTSVNAIDSKEDDLSLLVDYIGRESARRIDQVFDKAEEIRKESDVRLQEVAKYLQYVAVESARQLQEVLNNITQVSTTVEHYLNDLQAVSEILNQFIERVVGQSDRIEAILGEIRQDQADIVSALAIVKQNGELAAQTVQVMNAHNSMLNAKIDALSHNLATCCTELNGNDAKIFSAVERIETALTSAPVRKPRKKPATVKSVDELSSVHTVKFIRNNNEIDITGLVMQLPGVYILTETIYFKEGGATVSGNNITLDLNGFSIISLSEGVVPLTIDKSDSVTVINGTFVGGQGIFVSNSNGITFNNLSVNDTTNKAISISAVTNATLNNVYVSNGIDGIVIDSASANIVCKNSVVCDCERNGVDLQANRIWIEDMIVQNNGSYGINVSNSSDMHIFRTSVDANGGNGIFIDSSVLRCQVESCRVSGNNGVGFYNNGAEVATWTNNFAQGNKEANYININAVSLKEAISFWYNVYGN